MRSGWLSIVAYRLAAVTAGVAAGLAADRIIGLVIVAAALGWVLVFGTLTVVRGRWCALIRFEVDLFLFCWSYALLGARLWIETSRHDPAVAGWFIFRVALVWAIVGFVTAWLVMISRMVAPPIDRARRVEVRDEGR